MHVIETDLGEVRALGVSPHGRIVAAAGGRMFRAFSWTTGEPLIGMRGLGPSEQVAFGPSGAWVARVAFGQLWIESPDGATQLQHNSLARYTGGVAASPDGKVLVATSVRVGAEQAQLDRFALPGLKPISGFAFWSPFRRLAFSPNGEFLAGVWDKGFELRFANSGGLDYRHRMPKRHEFNGPGFVSFSRDSHTCAFGWSGEFHLLDVSTGTSKPGPRVEAAYRDAAFCPGTSLFATVGDDGRLKFWDPATWQVAREYDWQCGPLTCLAFTPDGSAGVCGTADGRLVQFDID